MDLKEIKLHVWSGLKNSELYTPFFNHYLESTQIVYKKKLKLSYSVFFLVKELDMILLTFLFLRHLLNKHGSIPILSTRRYLKISRNKALCDWVSFSVHLAVWSDGWTDGGREGGCSLLWREFLEQNINEASQKSLTWKILELSACLFEGNKTANYQLPSLLTSFDSDCKRSLSSTGKTDGL